MAEINVTEVFTNDDGCSQERAEKTLNALVKEWSTWSKYDAVTAIAPTMAKNIDKALHIES
eukprot:6390928-Pyramimonas_sp.AAC.1